MLSMVLLLLSGANSFAANIDQLKGSIHQDNLDGSSPAAEEEWANGILSDLGLADTCYLLKYEADGDGNPEESEYVSEVIVREWVYDGGDVWKTQFYDGNLGIPTATPDYFLIKTGELADATHFLFENVDDKSWAVIDLSDMGLVLADVTDNALVAGDTRLFDRFSHITLFADCSPVPEPSSLALMLIGMFGLSRFRKKRSG